MNTTNLLLALKLMVIAAAGYALYKLSNLLVKRLQSRDYLTEQTAFVANTVSKWIIFVLVFLLVCQAFGIAPSHVLAALSAVLVLVAVGFVAVWSVLSNILCSFLLLLFPPFRFGDEIEIKDPEKEHGVKGKVTGLNLFFTTLQLNGAGPDEKIFIRVPNTIFFQRVIICREGTDTQDLKLKSVPIDHPPAATD